MTHHVKALQRHPTGLLLLSFQIDRPRCAPIFQRLDNFGKRCSLDLIALAFLGGLCLALFQALQPGEGMTLGFSKSIVAQGKCINGQRALTLTTN